MRASANGGPLAGAARPRRAWPPPGCAVASARRRREYVSVGGASQRRRARRGGRQPAVAPRRRSTEGAPPPPHVSTSSSWHATVLRCRCGRSRFGLTSAGDSLCISTLKVRSEAVGRLGMVFFEHVDVA